MKLTPEQRAALDKVCGPWKWIEDQREDVFLAGLRMGRAEGREQAAKACESVREPDDSSPDFGLALDMCVDAIRMLPEEPT